jgi:hypothetical protein
MEKKVNLGKRLKVGDGFLAITKKMFKGNHWYDSPRFKLYKIGERDYFQKGKRRYYCEVRGLVETKVGWSVKSTRSQYTTDNFWQGRRYWQFTYLVKILEN